MSRKTRAERKAEEARIIAEMQAAMSTGAPIEAQTPSAENDGGMYASRVEKIYCKRCKTAMEKGVCPVCGYRTYTPMDGKKRTRIRIIAALLGIAVFAVLFFVLGIGR